MIIAVPSFYRGKKLRPVVCGKKALLNMFTPGMQPAVADKEFAKIPDSFYRIEDSTDHFEVLLYHFGLLGDGWRIRYRFAGQNGMKALINPGISNCASGDEDAVELSGP